MSRTKKKPQLILLNSIKILHMDATMHNFSMWITETNPTILHKTFNEMLTKAGFNVLSHTEHHFNPQGWTVLYLLSESHFAIHTFPEHGKAYIELSSCVEKPFREFIAQLK